MDTLIKFFMKNKFISWYRYILHWKESNWLLCLQDMGLKFLGLEKKKNVNRCTFVLFEINAVVPKLSGYTATINGNRWLDYIARNKKLNTYELH